MEKDRPDLYEKWSFNMLELSFSKLDWFSYVISITKTVSKNKTLIRSTKLLSSKDARYLLKSAIRSCIECCCNVWAGALSCLWIWWISYRNRYLGLLVLHRLLLWPIGHCQNVTNFSLFHRYYFNFNICSSELAELVSCSYSLGRSARYSNRLQDFPVALPRCYKEVHVNRFFLCTASGILCL